MFTRAIVKTPGKSLVNGLTSAGLGVPVYEKAISQHKQYIHALAACGLEVTVLPPDELHPDSTFVEDTALVTPRGAIITHPGAPSRAGETAAIKAALSAHFANIEEIHAPGTVDAGDILMVGSHYYIGLSKRTNAQGARQIIDILKGFGMSGSTIPLKHVLHLKTGVSYLENNHLVTAGEFLKTPEFQSFSIIKIADDERYAANGIWINGTVLLAKGFPKAQKAIQAAGYPTIAVDVSEFRKLDGGLSCLSLRF